MTISENSLAGRKVQDVMHTGILMTDPGTPLRVVARMMGDRRVHAVAIADEGYTRRPLSIVTTLDVAAAVGSGADLTAGEAARSEVVTVRADQSIEEAARLMADHRAEHLIVVNPGSGHAEGILSSLDVAAGFGC